MSAGAVLITGEDALAETVATGLAAAGRAVRWLRTPGGPADGPPGVEIVPGTLAQRFTLPRLLAGCDTVVHLAVREDLGGLSRDELYAVNVEGAGHLLTAAREAGIRRYVHRSSVLARGSASGARGGAPAWDLGDVQLTAVQSLRLAELEALRQAGLGLPAVVWTPAPLIGPGATGPVADLLALAAAGRLPLVPDLCVDVATVADAAAAACALAVGDAVPARARTVSRTASLLTLAAEAAGAAGRRGPLPVGLEPLARAARALSALGSRRRAGLLALASRQWSHEGLSWEEDGDARRR